MNDWIILILKGYIVLFILQTILWFVQLKTRDASTADVGWTVGMIFLVGWYSINTDGLMLRKFLIFIPLFIWAVRLSSHIIRRMLSEAREDSRYARLRERWGNHANRNFFIIYQLQPIFNVVLSTPFIFIFQNEQTSLHWLEISALVLWSISFLGEAIADEQLKRFKLQKQNKGKVCQQGLWNYSRHPNFFFEWMLWVSYATYALSSPMGWAGFVSPVFMLFLLMKVTGIPMIEQHALKTKGESFRKYMQTTSMFIPLPKIKGA